MRRARKNTMVLIGAAALTLSGAGCSREEGSAEAMGPQKFEAAGIPVIHKRVTANDVIAVRMYLKGGSANLTPETQGIENFIGSVMTRGSEKFDKDEFAARAQATGTRIGGMATYDYSVATLQAVAEHWDASWDLFTQAVLHPTFPESEVELARAQILDELRQRVDDPDDYLRLLANDLFYSGHPYQLDPDGTVESIGNLTRDDLASWHSDRLSKENLVFVVVGNVGREDLDAKISSAFGALPERGGSARMAPPLAPGAERLRTIERDIPTNYIRGQFRAPAPESPDYPAIEAAMSVLDERLFEEVRTKRGLSYAVQAGVSVRRANYGVLYVTAVEPDTTIKVMFREVDRLKQEDLTPEELAGYVSPYLTRHWMGQQTNMGQADELGLYEVVGGGWERALDYQEALRSVSPEDVRRVAAEYLGGMRFAVIGDPGKIDAEVITAN